MSHILSFLDTIQLSKIRVQSLNRQLGQKLAEIETCQRFKKGLYEAFIEGTVSKEDYDLFYADYTHQQKEITVQTETLRGEMNAILAGKDEYGLWMENFKKHRGMTQLNRSIVVELVARILIYSKDTIEITFRYQGEYDKLFAATHAAPHQEVV